MSDLHNEQQVRESVQHIADRAATRAVTEVLTMIGIDVQNPIVAQEQFASLRRIAIMMGDKEFAEDLAWLRRLREATDTAKKASISSAVKVIVTAALGIFALGTKDWWLSYIMHR